MKPSNFNFLYACWPEVYEAAQEAERTVYTKAVTSGMYSRQAMELLLNWVYDFDVEYELPYRNNLAAKINGEKFSRDAGADLVGNLEYIRKVGNNATHSRRISQREALAACQFLFRFGQYVVRTYTDERWPEHFDEAHVPTKDPVLVKLKKIAELEAALAKEQAENERQRVLAEANEKAKAERQNVRTEAAAHKAENRHLPLPESPVSEAETRRLYIDADLQKVGWDLDEPNVKEYEVDNMPAVTNPTRRGFIDYVLWGEDGLPLAVVEAKRTSRNAKEGKTQAALYTDCLAEKFGRRPIIFYTNGIETHLWDDQFYPPRPVSGFYSRAELQLLIDRRLTRRDLRKYTPNADIAGRYYQREAIQRIAERFVTDGPDGQITGNFRQALVVMATGTGKTRTAIALVDILLKANWAKRVLFLADRNALVTQAKGSFNEHLPECTAIDLTKEGESSTTRLVFSTYPTILNRIDSARNPDSTVYGPGHFDLIIVDEAHRSIYQKYEDIFHYFDALVVGLTATPRGEVGRDTYRAFNCEGENPTYYYEIDQGVNDGFLRPPKKVNAGTKFLRRGIKYSELSEAEKEEFEKAFAKMGEEAPDEVSASAINKWLFNEDTVIKVLDRLMSEGHRVESGDKIGKTIIFANSQAHAEYIEKVFNEQYPELRGQFAQIISYKEKYAEASIANFKLADRNPQIAISVDMLDTGIDVPEIVNLVFFKPVYSKAKFWQMIGRGTRLCPNLFGPEEDKKDFYIFDCCGNFEFFEIMPEGKTAGVPKSVSHRIFELRMLLAEALRRPEFLEDEILQNQRNELLDLSHAVVAGMYENRRQFRLKLRLTTIEKFRKRKDWDDLGPTKVYELSDRLGPLVSLDDKDEKAKLFDALLYKMELAHCTGDPSFEAGKNNLIGRAEWLASMANIPAVREKLPLITRMQSEVFWKDISLPTLEKVRQELRSLMRLLVNEKQDPVYTNFADPMPTFREAEAVDLPSAPANYLERVKSFVRKNREYVVIKKICSNQPITPQELEQLEDMLFDGSERGTRNDLMRVTGEKRPLGQFIRSILGMEKGAALSAFSEFLQNESLSADQQKFIEIIINNFVINGVVEPKQLYESPFTDLNTNGLDGLFNDGECANIVSIIREVNGGAMVG